MILKRSRVLLSPALKARFPQSVNPLWKRRANRRASFSSTRINVLPSDQMKRTATNLRSRVAAHQHAFSLFYNCFETRRRKSTTAA